MSPRQRAPAREAASPRDEIALATVNQADAYGVRIVVANAKAGESHWQVVSVRHLLPQENQGRHNVYVDALDEAGKRCRDAALRIGWTWEGRHADEIADAKPLDKPDNEPAGNLPIERGQHIELWIQGDGLASDHVQNIHTSHPDEPATNGQLWNTYGHHSFQVVFQRRAAEHEKPVPVEPTPPPPPFAFTVWPTEIRTVTQWFGANPQYYAQFGLPGHEGVDMVAPLGTRIFSVAPGRVSMVHPEPTGHNYGTHVRVLHAQGYETIYAHLQSLQVQEGEEVQAGQVLGLADHTGNAEGDHLHLTLKHQGESLGAYPGNIIDPTPFLVPLLAVAQDGAEYVSDKIPDGSSFPAGSTIVETWRMRNSGNTTWVPGYELALCGGDALGAAPSASLPAAAPGQEVDVTVSFQAPPGTGRYRSLWRCRNASGAWFGDRVWVDILVVPREEHKVTRQITVKEKLGIDANAPIDPRSGAISPQVADSAIIGDIGTGWVRLNFILGPWQDPLDVTQHSGRTWEQTYRTTIDAMRARGLKIYGLINHEALHEGPGSQLRDAPPSGSNSNSWVEGYADTFQKIARLFRDGVDIFETFNEPDNWTRLPGEGQNDPQWRRPWIHPEWFAIILQEIWNRVRGDPATAGIRIVSGPLEGLDTGNGARDYLRRTYQAGKRRFGWGQGGVPVPFEGVGYHLYIAQDPPNPRLDIPAKYNQYTAELRQVITEEEGAPKPIFVSEMGWRSSIGEDKQADCMRAGLQCILDDPGVALGIWFCTQDWSENWGLYRQGDLSPAGRKPSYAALKSACGDARLVTSPEWLPVAAGPLSVALEAMPLVSARTAPPAVSALAGATVPVTSSESELRGLWRQHIEQGLAKNQALFGELIEATTFALKAAGEAPGDAAGNLQAAARLSVILNTYWSRLAHAIDPATLQQDFDAISRAAMVQLRELSAVRSEGEIKADE